MLLVAVPPAIAVIPFTDFLRGNTTFSLLATVACYLGALIITPLIALAFLGTSYIEPRSLVMVIVELIGLPLLVSRVLLWTSMAARLEPIKGTITNWSFFVVTVYHRGAEPRIIPPAAVNPGAGGRHRTYQYLSLGRGDRQGRQINGD